MIFNRYTYANCCGNHKNPIKWRERKKRTEKAPGQTTCHCSLICCSSFSLASHSIVDVWMKEEKRRERKKKWKSYQNYEKFECVLCVHENADRNTISIVSHSDQFDRRKKLSHNSIVALHTNKYKKKMIAECPMLNTIDENEIETRFVFFFCLLSQSSLRSDIYFLTLHLINVSHDHFVFLLISFAICSSARLTWLV